ncbi:hypothetical protein V1L54_26715 [Streptomyces sp. TRM 70361]|uniref:hypothetical protein n=1 Tax=Streptomyces sp. TRM 70361 TaxID=3116553 RepID=UPI002E7BC54D|nr:hypothetical protein [Streptomyces sp. TRM 70361]MEE1942957.1 hypothetical protein [Streptomyces sp. TRM 70361]
MSTALTRRPTAQPTEPADRSAEPSRSAGPPRFPRPARWGPAPPAWWPLALGALLGLLGGAAYGTLATPRYTATSYVVVVPGERSDATAALGFAQAYGRVATEGTVLAAAGETARMPVRELRSAVRAATSPDAPMVEITGTASHPDRAAAVANAVADALTRTGNRAADGTGVRLSSFSSAFAPDEPTSPSPALAAAVGGCAGGLVGALALLAAPRPRRTAAALPGVPAPAPGPDHRRPVPPGPADTRADTRADTAGDGTAADRGTAGDPAPAAAPAAVPAAASAAKARGGRGQRTRRTVR